MEQAAVHNDLLGIAIVALAALACGLGLERLRQPAIIGYIIAGVILGPSGFELVPDRSNLNTLAELGVLLLLFVVGMELSLRSFRLMWRLFVLATLFQIAVSGAVMLALSTLFGWPIELAVVLGFAVALSSTAVVIKILEDLGELRSRVGRTTVGILIAQDLAVVPMMLMVGAMSGEGFHLLDLAKIALSVALLIGLILWLGEGPKVRLPFARLVGGHADLMPLAALCFCFGAAALSGLLGMSAAYGAFLAGLVIGNSHERAAMVRVTHPIQSVLMMVFFLSIGLLIDLGYVWENIGTVLMLLFLVTVFKTVLNIAILRFMEQSWTEAFLIAILMAQMGEFSFLLSMTAVQNGLIDAETTRLVVAVTALSLAIGPLWVITARRLHVVAARRTTSLRQLLQVICGHEAEVVLEGIGGAKLTTVKWARQTVLAAGKLKTKLTAPGKRPPPAGGAKPNKPAQTAAADTPADTAAAKPSKDENA
jgi:CPA2 family monovalent cation:H+ antiporter-2